MYTGILKTGDLIELGKRTNLKGMEGILKVESMDETSYSFSKPKGRNIIARHFKTVIDVLVEKYEKNADDIEDDILNDPFYGDLNYIKKIN